MPTEYVAPERTDRPAEDALVAAVAADWADRLGLREEVVVARRMSADANREAMAEFMQGVTRAWSDTAKRLAEAVRPALAQVGDTMRQLRSALVESGAVPDEPPSDPMAHALHLRQHRNTGPAVHADPRRNRRR